MKNEEIRKIGENYIWKATFSDNKVIEEYSKNEETNKYEMTSFSEVQQKEDLEKYELIGQDCEVSFDKDGIFTIGKDKMGFEITDVYGNNLLSHSKNNLMMYRTNEQDLKNVSMCRVVAYVFGYKINNESVFFKVKFHVTTSKIYFTVECAPKKDIEINFVMTKNDKVIADEQIKLIKDKKMTITI